MVENLNSFILNHGLMEAGYVNHEAGTLHSSVSASGPVDAESLSVSMTATMDSRGNLVLGKCFMSCLCTCSLGLFCH